MNLFVEMYACSFVCVSTAEQLGGAERRGDVARRPQDLLPDVRVPVQPVAVVHRGRHGRRPLQRLVVDVAQRHRRPTLSRHRQRPPRARLGRLDPVLAETGSGRRPARLEPVHGDHRVRLPRSVRRQRKDLRHDGTFL